MVPCSFCMKDSCNDCEIPYEAEKDLNTCLERGEKLMQAEIHIVWKVSFRHNSRVEDAYDDWKRYRTISESSNAAI